jgi:hypothetical protein
MKHKTAIEQTSTFTINIPTCSAERVPNTNHQLTLEFSNDVAAGATAVVSTTPYGCPMSEAVSGGSLDAYALAGSSKTVLIQGLLLTSLTVTLAGFSAGDVSAYYTGYGANDPGYDDQYS